MAKKQSNIVKLMVDEDNPDGLYHYELPKMPSDEKEIWYYDLPKSEQFWLTPHNKSNKWLTSDGRIKNISRMDEAGKIDYIDYWRDKWENGLWVFINGVPTYLTGMHIDHLIFNKVKKNWYYTDSQRLRFYFRELTNRDPLCDGRVWVKGRRVGITSEEITEGVRCINKDYGNHVACQSDTFPKAKSTLLDKIIETHIRRPDWMREVFYSSNGKVPRSKLELIDVVIRDDEDYPLGGTARAFPTTVKAIDGEEFMLVIMDELSKWQISPREAYDVNIKTIVNPGKRGKLDALSTTGDSDEAQKAVRDWHQLIADSNPKVRNNNGKTNSGLYHYFVSYADSFELIERYPHLMDIYGKVNYEKAEEIIWNEMKHLSKDSKQYIYQLYKMPTRMRHALLTPSTQSYFSKPRISVRLDELRTLPFDKKPYVVGSLEEDQSGKIYFISNAEKEREAIENGIKYTPGYWWIAVQPYFSFDKNIDTRNRYRKINGLYYPPVNPEGCIGYDPIRYKKEDTSSRHLSEAAIIGYQKYDYFNSGNANKYTALWLHRPDDPREANKECIKYAKFTGFPVMHERVIESVKEDFIEANMLPFLLTNPKDGLHGMWIDGQHKVVQNAIDLMVTKFSVPKSPEDIDMIATMPFEPVLTDMDGFDLKMPTTMFNVFMAMVELEHGLKQISQTSMTDKSHLNKLAIINEIFSPRN